MRHSLPFTWFSEEVISKVRAGGWERSVSTEAPGGRFQAQRAAQSRALGWGTAWPVRVKKAGVAQVREGQAGATAQRPPACSISAPEDVHPRGLRPWPVSPRSVPGPGLWLWRARPSRGRLPLPCPAAVTCQGDLQQMQISVKPAVVSGAAKCENMPTGL